MNPAARYRIVEIALPYRIQVMVIHLARTEVPVLTAPSIPRQLQQLPARPWGRSFRPNPGTNWESWYILNVSYQILAYYEQGNVYQLFEARKNLPRVETWDNADAPAKQRLKVFICPSSPLLTN